MQIQIAEDVDSVAHEVASYIAAAARLAVLERGQFAVGFSGGQTPLRMLRCLAQEDVPWERVHVVQVDERIVPPSDPERNLPGLIECLHEAPLRPEQIYPMPVESTDLEAAATRYALTLREMAGLPPVLDLVHLGLGIDGHTASLFPEDPVLEVTASDVALTLTQLGSRRMTLTLPMLNRSRQIVWMVTGSAKAKVLARLCKGDVALPAGAITTDCAMVFADKDAAGMSNEKD